MDFFKSVFSDPDPPQSPTDSPRTPPQQSSPFLTASATTGDAPSPGAWSFGGIIKTIATKSETVIQTYRRDLEEFGSGLKKETALIRDAAARVVLDLPGSLEAGASVAQESLETVGQAIDDIGGSVWRGTAGIISQGKDALLSVDAEASDHDSWSQSNPGGGVSKRYSRFEAQLLAIQSDPSTFADEPEDGEEFRKWKEGFGMEEKEEEIEALLYENNGLEVIFEKMVPNVVDLETFWSRYFYKVHKLKQVEDARANLVKRVISREDEEELSWEVDEEEEEKQKEGQVEEKKEEEELDAKNEEKERETVEDEKAHERSNPLEEQKHVEMPTKLENSEVTKTTSDDTLPAVATEVEVADTASTSNELKSKSDEHVQPEIKAETGESWKDSDVSVVSSQPSMPEEDDLGWDEIEDLGEHDDKKAGGSNVSPNRVDLRKRLSVAEDDEDLSWDIEDDDDQAKP